MPTTSKPRSESTRYSELFRMFQAEFRTSRVSPEYGQSDQRRAMENEKATRARIANEFRLKERKRNEWRIRIREVGALRETEGAALNRSWRRDSRHAGPVTGVHPVWMGHSARDCRRIAGAASVPGRRRNLRSRSRAAFLHRMLGCGCLLRGEPEVAVHG